MAEPWVKVKDIPPIIVEWRKVRSRALVGQFWIGDIDTGKSEAVTRFDRWLDRKSKVRPKFAES